MGKYFNNISNLKELKKAWRELAMKHHPDIGGDGEVMKEINNEYDKLFPVYRNIYNFTAPDTEYSKESSESDRNEFYTRNGWKGENYNSNLRTMEISTIIRKYLKQYYPDYKFSVITKTYSGGSNLKISLMESPHEVFRVENLSKYEYKDKYIQCNQYHLENDSRINQRTKLILSDVINYINSYRMDDSDSMIDYFHTNFYYDMNIGKWNKPFTIVEKQPKISSGNLKTTHHVNGKNMPVSCTEIMPIT